MSYFSCFVLAKCKVTQKCVSQHRTRPEFYNPIKRRKCNLCSFLHLIQFHTDSLLGQRRDRETEVYQCFIYMDTCRTMMTNEDRLYGTFLQNYTGKNLNESSAEMSLLPKNRLCLIKQRHIDDSLSNSLQFYIFERGTFNFYLKKSSLDLKVINTLKD